MAEVEIGEMKITGGKMLVLIPLLGTIIGGLWGGFELYQRLLTAEEAIVNYVSPDFSHYDESLAVLQVELETLKDKMDNEFDDLKEEVDRIQSLARDVDDSVADTQRELRDDVYALEERVNDSLREVDAEVRKVRGELEDKIEKILENPLNDAE